MLIKSFTQHTEENNDLDMFQAFESIIEQYENEKRSLAFEGGYQVFVSFEDLMSNEDEDHSRAGIAVRYAAKIQEAGFPTHMVSKFEDMILEDLEASLEDAEAYFA